MRQWVGTDAASSDALGGNFLAPNLTNAEATTAYNTNITPTGFKVDGITAGTYIYIAIRRGPMKVPTSGTSVFSPLSINNSTGTINTTNFPIDLQIAKFLSGDDNNFYDRLRRVNSTSASDATPTIVSNTTAAETGPPSRTRSWDNTGFSTAGSFGDIASIFWNFRRAPTFFDEVCYSGDSTLGRAIPHNLAAVPEFMIVKNRNNAENWVTYSAPTGNTTRMILNSPNASGTRAIWANTTPTSTNFYVGGSGVLGETNASGSIYVAYLFATCAGVSKVGSYTGNGSTQTINCGFGAGGARFVLIKRTNSTGDWYVYDTARGMTILTDPYILLNTSAAETATLGSVTTVSTGFALNSSILAAINVNAGTYIFLAIA
jgi:hypothetical protein